jgi:hypothetical protein
LLLVPLNVILLPSDKAEHGLLVECSVVWVVLPIFKSDLTLLKVAGAMGNLSLRIEALLSFGSLSFVDEGVSQ